MSNPPPPYSRLRGVDVLPQAAVALRTRRTRAALSMLGIAIGIASIVAVLGITRSSQSDLLARIDRLGTNLLVVANAESATGEPTQLPATAAATIARTEGVRHAAPTADLTGVRVYRSDLIPRYRTNGLSVRTCDTTLLSTLDGRLAHGTFLNALSARYPIAVLGHDAARQLGIARVDTTTRIWLGDHWFQVAGVLRPLELAPEINSAALISTGAATRYFDHDARPDLVYVRTDTVRTAQVADLLGRAAKPEHPEEVAVSRPSDALSARLAVADSGTALFLGLGAVALLVGAIGIANVMVISVLERRGEIGLRRALGAARRHVAAQFLVESLLLAGLGGVAGVALGVAGTYTVAVQRGWHPLIPAGAIWAGLGGALLIGAIAGLYPALRAARLPPADALRTN